MEKLKLDIQFFAAGDSNQIGIEFKIDAKTFKSDMANIRKQIATFTTELNSLKMDDDLEKSFEGMSRALELNESRLKLQETALDGVRKQMLEVEKAHKGNILSTEAYNNELDKLKKELDDGEITAKEYKDQVKLLDAEYENGRRLTKEYEDGLASLKQQLDNGEITQKKYDKGLKELNKSYINNSISTSEYEKQMTNLMVVEAGLKRDISNTNKEILSQKDAIDSADSSGATFQKRLSDLDNEILQNNKAFEKSVSHLTNWQDTTEGISAKIKSLNTVLDTQQRRLQELSGEYDRVKDKEEVSQDTKNKLINEITKQYQAISKTKSELVKYEDSLGDAERRAKELKNQIDKLTKAYKDEASANGKSSEKARELKSDIDKLSGEYKILQREIENADKKQEKANKGWTIARSVISNLVTDAFRKALEGLKEMGEAAWRTSVEFESAFAGVRKTVDATDEELKTIEEDILNLSKRVPTTANEIARVAEIAGQLGIDNDKIVNFSEVMIGMSEAFEGVSAEDASLSLAKFANITKMSQKDFDRLGSVITELGNNFPTLEGNMIDMATRIAATGEVVGLTEPEIMGLATAISSVGIEAEAGKLYCPAY